MNELVRITRPEFSATVSHDGAKATAHLEGNADYAAVEEVKQLLKHVHDATREGGFRVAMVDLRQLEFMNSSCFKCFVSWIADVQDLDAAAQYRIEILSNPELHWQRRSLHALRAFAPDLITIVT